MNKDKQAPSKSEWQFGFAEDDTEMEDEDQTYFRAESKDATAMSVFDFASVAPTPTAQRLALPHDMSFPQALANQLQQA